MSKRKQSKREQNIHSKKTAEKPNSVSCQTWVQTFHSVSCVTRHLSLNNNYILLGYFTLRHSELPKVIMPYIKFS